MTVTAKGWVVQWQHQNTDEWFPDDSQRGRDLSVAMLRKRPNTTYVLPTRREATRERDRCYAEWVRFCSPPNIPKFRIRRATVTLHVSEE